MIEEKIYRIKQGKEKQIALYKVENRQCRYGGPLK